MGTSIDFVLETLEMLEARLLRFRELTQKHRAQLFELFSNGVPEEKIAKHFGVTVKEVDRWKEAMLFPDMEEIRAIQLLRNEAKDIFESGNPETKTPKPIMVTNAHNTRVRSRPLVQGYGAGVKKLE